jgi:predicted membrane-bound spermidine synthase
MKVEHKKINIYSHFRPLLFPAFISGGAVMVAELISAKMIAAYFGNSLYVWTAVLAITLGGLASGYFAGGFFSMHKKNAAILFFIFLFLSVFMFLMPGISSLVMDATITMSLKSGILTSALVFIFPPLMAFGMVSPMIIGRMEHALEAPEKLPGIVYSISTIGGILFTFLAGYFFIPYFGLKETCYIISGLLLISTLSIFYFRNNHGKKVKIK